MVTQLTLFAPAGALEQTAPNSAHAENNTCVKRSLGKSSRTGTKKWSEQMAWVKHNIKQRQQYHSAEQIHVWKKYKRNLQNIILQA